MTLDQHVERRGNNSAEPLVSVCTPTYCRPAYLAELIESVRSQTYQRWEMWICDNSEDDRTARMVESIRDSRLRYEKNERNIGMGGNALRVLSKATGELFTFTPDDDVWEPTNLERKVGFLRSNGHLQVVFSNADRISPRGEKLRRFRSTYFDGAREIPASELRPSVDVERQYFVNILTAVMRRDLMPVFRMSWHLNTEELFMWYLGCSDGRLGYLGERLVRLREAEHHRVVQHRGRLIDFKGNSGYRQRQLLDFYRTLLTQYPETAEVLDSASAKAFVGKALVGSARGVGDLARAALLYAAGLDDPPWMPFWAALARQPVRWMAGALRRGSAPSGLGPVDTGA